MTNGRFQVSEFNDSFPAINLKRRQSPGDPKRPMKVNLIRQEKVDKPTFDHAIKIYADYSAMIKPISLAISYNELEVKAVGIDN